MQSSRWQTKADYLSVATHVVIGLVLRHCVADPWCRRVGFDERDPDPALAGREPMRVTGFRLPNERCRRQPQSRTLVRRSGRSLGFRVLAFEIATAMTQMKPGTIPATRSDSFGIG